MCQLECRRAAAGHQWHRRHPGWSSSLSARVPLYLWRAGRWSGPPWQGTFFRTSIKTQQGWTRKVKRTFRYVEPRTVGFSLPVLHRATTCAMRSLRISLCTEHTAPFYNHGNNTQPRPRQPMRTVGKSRRNVAIRPLRALFKKQEPEQSKFRAKSRFSKALFSELHVGYRARIGSLTLSTRMSNLSSAVGARECGDYLQMVAFLHRFSSGTHVLTDETISKQSSSCL